MKKQNGRKKNKGFTLIELIVAMTVLSVIVVPLLRAFVTAALANKKAAEIQRATTCAQNMIETLKSCSVSGMALNVYGYSTDDEGKAVKAFPLSSFTGKDETGAEVSVAAFEARAGAAGLYSETLTPCVTNSALGGRFESPSAEQDELCFVFPKVEQDGSSYDMVLSLTPGKQATSVTIRSMSGSDCVYFAQPDDEADNAATSFAYANGEYCNRHQGSALLLDKGQFEQRMTRTVTLDISTSAEGVLLTEKTVYDCGAGYTESADRRFTITETTIHDTDDGALASVYLFYYPLYGNGYARDSFIINNQENIDLNIYLIAMENADYTALNAAAYKVKLTVNERFLQTEYQGEGARTELHTELLSNVDNSQFILDDGNPSVAAEVRTLGRSGESTYMYRMTLTVYEHDDDAFLRSNGRTSFIGAEDHYLAEFEGSALN